MPKKAYSEPLKTTIKIRGSTRDLLAEQGKKNETYDTIILRLIENGHKYEELKAEKEAPTRTGWRTRKRLAEREEKDDIVIEKKTAKKR